MFLRKNRQNVSTDLGFIEIANLLSASTKILLFLIIRLHFQILEFSFFDESFCKSK